MLLTDLVFVGFNSYVLALDRESGETVWHWQAPRPRTRGYVTQLLDGDRLIVSVNGYIYCLDPLSGDTLWSNETKGFGTGIASIASLRGHSSDDVSVMTAAQEADQAAAAAATA